MPRKRIEEFKPFDDEREWEEVEAPSAESRRATGAIVGVRFSASDADRLHKVARARGISVSGFIRKATELYLSLSNDPVTIITSGRGGAQTGFSYTTLTPTRSLAQAEVKTSSPGLVTSR